MSMIFSKSLINDLTGGKDPNSPLVTIGKDLYFRFDETRIRTSKLYSGNAVCEYYFKSKLVCTMQSYGPMPDGLELRGFGFEGLMRVMVI